MIMMMMGLPVFNLMGWDLAALDLLDWALWT